ncbi:serine carboxypeptidase S28-domain-containing protein [Calycina marina]|uniref:Serine carboxypeptidase S28-domain-containing protein n=1 Tax=Calycina marina TaxID=1763456 RepID=A0A9P8CDC7_9HELO|nr:serine carboxypeptidase S28-domain-containing protein [Calycina marina]
MKARFSFLVLCLATLTVAAKGNVKPFGARNIPLPPAEAGDEFPVVRNPLFTSATANYGANLTGTAFFDQLLDHNDPNKGKFKQQYWWNATTWAGKGSPVVFFTPGEVAAAAYTGYLTNRTIVGIFAQEINGAAVILEHRYYGASSPYDTLTVENLQLLTVEQAILDATYFAQTVDFAFDTDHSSNAANAPWVFSGGSYSGALAAWTESVYPGVFWAYHASSAPVEAIEDFWEYFSPIQNGMAQNCSADTTLVIDYVDNILKKGTAAEVTALKIMFGFEALEHAGDFGNVLQSGPWNWQDQEAYTGYSGFQLWCDYVENIFEANSTGIPGAAGVGLQKALAGYADYIRPEDNGKDVCTGYGYAEYDFGCYDSYDPNNVFYTDLTIDNIANRHGAPSSTRTIVSRFVDETYWQQQCPLYFPTEVTATGTYTYRSNLSPDNNVHKENEWTQGWRLEATTRLTWTNGEYDPWMPAGVSSPDRPNGPLASTAQHPVNVIPKGIHCYDLIAKNGVADPGTQAVIDTEVKQIVEWVDEYYKK